MLSTLGNVVVVYKIPNDTSDFPYVSDHERADLFLLREAGRQELIRRLKARAEELKVEFIRIQNIYQEFK